MTAQILHANGKPALAVLPIDEYRALLELAEDARDARTLTRAARRMGRGRHESIPATVVDRLLAVLLGPATV